MMDNIYYEDLQLHQTYRSEGYPLTEEKIIEFSWEWDPGEIHVDPQAARASRFHGVIAPAVMMMCIWMKLVREQKPPRAYVTGLGWDQVRFLMPGRPGDVIYWEEELIAKRESNSDPTVGIVQYDMRLLNQRDETLFIFQTIGMIERRPVL